jgi:hypothetical protein
MTTTKTGLRKRDKAPREPSQEPTTAQIAAWLAAEENFDFHPTTKGFDNSVRWRTVEVGPSSVHQRMDEEAKAYHEEQEAQRRRPVTKPKPIVKPKVIATHPRTREEFEAAVADACRVPFAAVIRNGKVVVPAKPAGPIFKSMMSKMRRSGARVDKQLAAELTGDLAAKATKRGIGNSGGPGRYDPAKGFPILQWLNSINDAYAEHVRHSKRHAPDNQIFNEAVEIHFADRPELFDNCHDSKANVVVETPKEVVEEEAAERKLELGWNPAWGKPKVKLQLSAATGPSSDDKLYSAGIREAKDQNRDKDKLSYDSRDGGGFVSAGGRSNFVSAGGMADFKDVSGMASASHATRGNGTHYFPNGLEPDRLWHDPIDRELAKAGLLCLTRRAVAEVLFSCEPERIEALSPKAKAKLKCQMADLYAPPDKSDAGRALRKTMLRVAYASGDPETIAGARSLLSPTERFRFDAHMRAALADEKMIDSRGATPEAKRALKNQKDSLREKAKAEEAKLAGKPSPNALAQRKRRAKKKAAAALAAE